MLDAVTHRLILAWVRGSPSRPDPFPPVSKQLRPEAGSRRGGLQTPHSSSALERDRRKGALSEIASDALMPLSSFSEPADFTGGTSGLGGGRGCGGDPQGLRIARVCVCAGTASVEKQPSRAGAFSSLTRQGAAPACAKRLFPAAGREVSPLAAAVSSGLAGAVPLPKALEVRANRSLKQQ